MTSFPVSPNGFTAEVIFVVLIYLFVSGYSASNE
jgi:hypothetical protein